jgi:hypothetical protein
MDGQSERAGCLTDRRQGGSALFPEPEHITKPDQVIVVERQQAQVALARLFVGSPTPEDARLLRFLAGLAEGLIQGSVQEVSR